MSALGHFRGDSVVHATAVVGCALPLDEAALFESAEQACEIGVHRHHAVRYLSARQRLARAPQNPQHVVLGRGELSLAVGVVYQGIKLPGVDVFAEDHVRTALIYVRWDD